MAKGRFPDPRREKRHTGHRPLPAQRALVGAPDVLMQAPPAAANRASPRVSSASQPFGPRADSGKPPMSRTQAFCGV